MEERPARIPRAALAAFALVLAVVAVWAATALAGGSSAPAQKAPAAKSPTAGYVQQRAVRGHDRAGDRGDCPFKHDRAAPTAAV